VALDSQRAKSIFLAALERAGSEREALLAEACAGDPDLRQRVERLLLAHERPDSLPAAPEAPPRATQDFVPPESQELPPTSPATPEGPGTVIGPYKLIQEIGEGGMGTVCMAQQTEPVKRLVAIKLIKPGMDSRQVIARFEAERQALALMDHPNIARVYDAGTTPGGRPYFVMELVKGIPITRYCDEHRLTPRQRLELFIPLCQAIQHAHQKGIIHRDIKPSNVLIAFYDSKPVPKIIDFGIAKATGPTLTEKTLVTGFGNIIGTLEYMSPEQAELNQLDIDTRSDVYLLGVLLYELLTGTTPLERKRLKETTLLEALRLIREEDPPTPSMRLSTTDEAPAVATNRGLEPKKLSRLVRGELDWIVMKALEKDRNRRYESASAFAADVHRYLADEPVQACPPSAWYRFRKFTRRNRRVLAAAGLILFCIALLGGGAGWMLRDRAAREQRLTTQVELFLDDVDRLEQEQKWPEALAAARRAEAALAGGEAGDAIRQRFADAHRDLAFVAWLDRIQQNRAAFVEGHFNDRGAERDYAAAFRDYGVDWESLPAEEAVARLRSKPALAVRVAAALEDWVLARWYLGEGEAAWKPLIAVARAIDPDPLRDRLRAAFDQQLTREVQGELHRLAESIDVKTVAPATLVCLARILKLVQLPDAALELLRKGQYANPADFWLNTELYSTFREREDAAETVRYASAAVAARPDSAVSHNNLGLALGHWGKLDEANAEFRKVIELDPKDAAPHCNLGIVLAKSGLPDEGIAELRKAIHLQDNAALHIELGQILHRQGKFEEEATEYREAIRLSMNDSRAHFNLGTVLDHQGKVDESIAELREAIRLKGDYPEAHCNLGLALQRKGELREALTEYQEALRLRMKFPEAYNAHHGLGEVLCSQGKMDEGIAEYREAIRLKEDYLPSHNKLGPALLKQGKLDEALVHYKKAAVLAPNDLWARLALGSFLCDQKHDYEGAIAEFRKAVALDQKHSMAHFNLGNLLLHKGDLDGAIAEYRKAIALDPTIALAHSNLGSALYRQDKLDEAIACYRKAIELDRKLAIAHDNLGRALHDKKDLEGAIREYHAALMIDPNAADVHSNLGNALREKNDLEGAFREFHLALKIDPNNAWAHQHFGEALDIKGLPDKAIVHYRKALALGLKDAEAEAKAHYNLGLILSGQGKLEEAITEYQQAIRLKKDFAVAHYNLGNALSQQRKMDEAIAEYREAIRIQEDYPEAHCNLRQALQEQGEFGQALDEVRRGHELGLKQPNWRYPSAEWVRAAEQLVALDARLAKVLNREAQPANSVERLALAQLCLVHKKLYATAARFYEGAFDAEPKLVAPNRYNAACAAALAAAGQGKDADKLEEKERDRLRRQALDWLRADLEATRVLLKQDANKAGPTVLGQMRHWLVDPALAGVRGMQMIASLPEAQRQDWHKLWDDVFDMLKQAEGKSTPEKKTNVK
jgi:tetratricopeptide (TPR) repeat protein